MFNNLPDETFSNWHTEEAQNIMTGDERNFKLNTRKSADHLYDMFARYQRNFGAVEVDITQVNFGEIENSIWGME